MRQGTAARELQRRQTRGRLVEAARELFARNGFERTTVDEIALAAGFSKGAYYFHFQSKEEVLGELLERWEADRTSRLQAALDESQPPGAVLLDALEALLAYEGPSARWQPVLIELWSQASRNESVRRGLAEAHWKWLGMLTDAFERAREEGMLKQDLDPAGCAALALSLHDGLAAQISMRTGLAQVSTRKLAAGFLAPMLTEDP